MESFERHFFDQEDLIKEQREREEVAFRPLPHHMYGHIPDTKLSTKTSVPLNLLQKIEEEKKVKKAPVDKRRDAFLTDKALKPIDKDIDNYPKLEFDPRSRYTQFTYQRQKNEHGIDVRD